jgi:hypothetical protein
MGNNVWREWDSLIRYFFCLEPDSMTDEEYTMRIAELQFVLKKIGMYGKKDGIKR